MGRQSALRAFPAHAGMNRLDSAAAWISAGVPRARGDEPAANNLVNFLQKRSPRTRG